MRRTSSAAGTLGLLLAAAATAKSGDDGPPPLIAPGEANPPAASATATPAPKVGAPKRSSTSLLQPRAANRATTGARPAAGATTARPRVDSTQPANPVLAPSAPDEPPPLDSRPYKEVSPVGGDVPPPLDGPQEMRSLPARPIGGNPRSQRRFGEPAAADRLPDSSSGLTLEPEEEDPSAKSKSRASQPAPAPRRRFGILPGPNRNLNPARPRDPGRDSSIRVEPRSDPAADAALKRRLEVKIREAVGNRARDIEVRVVDRSVVVKAVADRFWNRRNVRRTIETLPALAGYKATVVVD